MHRYSLNFVSFRLHAINVFVGYYSGLNSVKNCLRLFHWRCAWWLCWCVHCTLTPCIVDEFYIKMNDENDDDDGIEQNHRIMNPVHANIWNMCECKCILKAILQARRRSAVCIRLRMSEQRFGSIGLWCPFIHWTFWHNSTHTHIHLSRPPHGLTRRVDNQMKYKLWRLWSVIGTIT